MYLHYGQDVRPLPPRDSSRNSRAARRVRGSTFSVHSARRNNDRAARSVGGSAAGSAFHTELGAAFSTAAGATARSGRDAISRHAGVRDAFGIPGIAPGWRALGGLSRSQVVDAPRRRATSTIRGSPAPGRHVRAAAGRRVRAARIRPPLGLLRATLLLRPTSLHRRACRSRLSRRRLSRRLLPRWSGRSRLAPMTTEAARPPAESRWLHSRSRGATRYVPWLH